MGNRSEMCASAVKDMLNEVYHRLYAAYGPQDWWPAQTPFEVILGAILTQNTRWENVRMALDNLRAAAALEPQALAALDELQLQELIRPSGFFRQKAATLRRMLQVLMDGYAGEVDAMLRGDTQHVRTRLLDIKGIGPETADSILLYGAQHPIFVIDAYTRRICSRLGLCGAEASYAQVQEMFMTHLCPDAQKYNEYHALLVVLAKRCCTKARPTCEACPLQELCSFSS
ncbi:MAG: endonuclease III domain-containing protein [Desulfuromonas sp.]|nr:endonuclease III domain-containing protein [Desulfuromonas sp.]